MRERIFGDAEEGFRRDDTWRASEIGREDGDRAKGVILISLWVQMHPVPTNLNMHPQCSQMFKRAIFRPERVSRFKRAPSRS